MNISEAFSLSFFISCIGIFLLLHFIFEWSFITDLFIPKNWRFFKIKKMRERRDTPLSGQGLSKEAG